MCGPDATVTIVDKITQPGSPRELRSRKEIKEWLENTYGRDMTHRLGHKVKDDRAAAHTQTCRYPDDPSVLRATLIEFDDGAIATQTVVQVSDEH
ncbi:MAG: nuclear transport factor 2 family protein [Solirubrobacteraceae bacterium]